MKPDMSRSPQMSFPSADVSLSANVTAAPNPPIARQVVHSQQLFGVANEVLIEHAGFTYRLRITSANKLILTK
jgi:hemin uptake protein HemP